MKVYILAASLLILFLYGERTLAEPEFVGTVSLEDEVSAVAFAASITQAALVRKLDESQDLTFRQKDQLRDQEAAIAELERSLRIARLAPDENRQAIAELELTLTTERASFVRQLAELDSYYAAQIALFEKNIAHLSQLDGASELLGMRSRGNLAETRRALDGLVREDKRSGASQGQFLANLRALVMLAEDDAEFGEADTLELLARYEELVSLDSGSPENWIGLSEYQALSGSTQDAYASAIRASELAVSPAAVADAFIAAAEASALAGNPAKAKGAAAQALEARGSIDAVSDIGQLTKLREVYQLLVSIAGEGSRFGEMRTYFSQIATITERQLELQPESISLKRQLANSLISSSMSTVSGGDSAEIHARFERAISLYLEVLETDPDAPQFLEDAYNAHLFYFHERKIFGGQPGGPDLPPGIIVFVEQQVSLAERLLELDPGSYTYQSYLNTARSLLPRKKTEAELRVEELNNLALMSQDEQMIVFQRQTEAARERAADVRAKWQAQREARIQTLMESGLSREHAEIEFEAIEKAWSARRAEADRMLARAVTLNGQSKFDEARPLLLDVLDQSEKALQEVNDPQWVYLKSRALESTALNYALRRDLEPALATYIELESFLSEMVELFPDDPLLPLKLSSATNQKLGTGAALENYRAVD
jgi:hypothetical protein